MNRFLKTLFPLIPVTGFLLFLPAVFSPVKGTLGHDYYHYIARILIGVGHFFRNGYAVPHFTASLCGGIPFFADPQSVYYSLPQFLSFWVDPIIATQTATVFFYGLGYVGLFRLCRRFELNVVPSHLAAFAYLLNGFSFEHLFVGHMTHQSFFLIPWWIHALFPPKSRNHIEVFQSVLGVALPPIYWIWSGSVHIIAVAITSAILFIPAIIYQNRKCIDWKIWAISCLLGVLFIGASTSGRIAAALSYSPQFIKHPIDRSGLSPFYLFFQYFWFTPEDIPMFIKFGIWNFGPWEYVGFLPKIAWVVIPFFLILCFRSLSRVKFIFAVAVILTCYLIMKLGVGSGLNSVIPGLRGYHNPIKLFGGFIPIWMLGFAVFCQWIGRYILRFFPTQSFQIIGYFIFCGILFGEYIGYVDYFRKNPTTVGFRYQPEWYQFISVNRGLPPVQKVVGQNTHDIDAIVRGETTTVCYEPLFGYRRETYRADLIEGSVTLMKRGSYNLTHPGCLVYPEYYNCTPWEKISVAEPETLQKFVDGDSDAFKIPFWQEVLLFSNLIVVLSVVGFAVVQRLTSLRWRRQTMVSAEA